MRVISGLVEDLLVSQEGLLHGSVWIVSERKPAKIFYVSVSQPPGRGPVPGLGINYTGPREVLLEFVILIF